MLGQVEHETDTKNRTSINSVSELTNPWEMVKNQIRLLNRSILMSELGVRPRLRFWALMSCKQTPKILLQGIQLLSSRTFCKWEKKHVRLWNHSILMSEIGVRPNYDVGPRWAWNGREKSAFNEFSFSAHEPLGNGKKNIPGCWIAQFWGSS